MAFSKCPKCESTLFEVTEAKPNHSTYKLMFVQCSTCGCIIGIMPFFDAGILAKDNQQKLNVVIARLDEIESAISRLVQALQ